MTRFDSSDVEAESRADAVFDALGDYERGQLAAFGTAFTTYEGLGDDVCACLNRRARAWRCSVGGSQK